LSDDLKALKSRGWLSVAKTKSPVYSSKVFASVARFGSDLSVSAPNFVSADDEGPFLWRYVVKPAAPSFISGCVVGASNLPVKSLGRKSYELVRYSKGHYVRARFIRPTPEPFLQRAQRLETMGSTGSALDLIYDGVDQLMRTGKFRELEATVSAMNASGFSTDLLLGMLTATLPVKNRLPSRAKLFRDTENILRQRGEYDQGLLIGLEP
jgi:hypothetical protein